MKEGKFLAFAGKKESKTFIRNKKNVPPAEFDDIISSWEKEIVYDKDNKKVELFNKYEVEKTPEQENVLNFVLGGVKDVLLKYGVEACQLEMRDIHLLKDECWVELNRENADGVSFPISSEIGIRFSENMTNLHLASITFHELMHQNSFVQVSCEGTDEEGNPKFVIERNALSVLDSTGERFYLENLNEAITAELQYRFIQNQRNNLLFKKDFEEMDNLYSKEEQKGASFMFSKTRKDGQGGYHLAKDYPEERENMYKIFDVIIENNCEKFSSREEVFNFFVKAYFKGDLMGVSRLLKKTYGDRPIKEIAEELSL